MRRTLLLITLCLTALAGTAGLLLSPTTGNESKPKDEPRIVAVKRSSVQTRVAETGTMEPALTIEIKSQVSGEVRRNQVAEGDQVAAGQPLLVIRQEPSQARQMAQVRASLEEERVNVEHAKRAVERMEHLLDQGFISQKDMEAAEEVNISRVAVDQPVEVKLDALPGRVFQGTVTAISPNGEKVNSIVYYQVKMEIDNKDSALRPLMTANVDILTNVLTDVIAIPLEALRTEHGDDTVYVMANGGRLARKVRVGLRTESQAVIMHGLQEGETVVIPSLSEKPS